MDAQRIILIGFMLAIVGQAQNILSGTTEPAGNGRKLVATFDGPPRSLATVVTGAPYSAEQVRTHTQTLSDGSHITETFPSRWMYRDSQGRRRMESWILAGPGGEPGIHTIEIRDFVAGYEYTLDTENLIAHRIRIPPDVGYSHTANTAVIPVDGPLPSFGVIVGGNRAKSVTETLGKKTIEGSLSDGRRVTTTIPVGLQGNDKALVSTVETWIAQDLKMVVLSIHSSPKDGETITRLININRAEPDQTLFQVPSNYRIVDEVGRFTIEVTRSSGDVKTSHDDEESIRKMLAKFADARNALDAQGMADAYAEDAEFVSFNGPQITGRAAIERDLIGPATKGGGRMERSLKGVLLMRPDLAVAEGDVHFRTPSYSRDFVEHYVLRKNAGRWQILFQRYVTSE
jgi:uncharacterized protein (TIGR02246 family)